MRTHFYDRVAGELASIAEDGLTKPEYIIEKPQGAVVCIAEHGGTRQAINLCANNYLGLASDGRVAAGAISAAEQWGSGTASVRFICGTLRIHKELEANVAEFLGYEDAILFPAAFDANGGVFDALLGADDAIVSDKLNHASLIDGIRLSKAKRYRFETGDMDDLERGLRAARADGSKTIVIATDGVFSMDGFIADLPAITALADRYEAIVLVDDCHASGFFGAGGRGTAAYHGVEGRIDILTSTFGKALGGAMGGFVAARRPVVELLRQRARPYLFSNALAPAVCGSSIEAIRIARSPEGEALRQKLFANADFFRRHMTTAGFRLAPGNHPIIPIMLGDARTAQQMARRLLELGVYAVGFSYPVVPKGQARIRTQMSAAHSLEHLDHAVSAFTTAGLELGIIQ